MRKRIFVLAVVANFISFDTGAQPYVGRHECLFESDRYETNDEARLQMRAQAACRREAEAAHKRESELEQAEKDRIRRQINDREARAEAAVKAAETEWNEAYSKAQKERKIAVSTQFAHRIESIYRDRADQVNKIGFPRSFLDQPIFVSNGLSYIKTANPRQYLSILLAAEPISEIKSVSLADSTGFSIKSQGSPTETYLFRADGEELYVSGFGRGPEISLISGRDALITGLALHGRYAQDIELIKSQVDRQVPAVPQPPLIDRDAIRAATGAREASETANELDRTLVRLRALQNASGQAQRPESDRRAGRQ